MEILAAAVIPLVALVGGDEWKWVVAGLGALITVLEGIQQVFRFRDNWLNYRATAEALRREIFLYRSCARPYRAGVTKEPACLLAERTAALASQENVKWISYSDKPPQEAGREDEEE